MDAIVLYGITFIKLRACILHLRLGLSNDQLHTDASEFDWMYLFSNISTTIINLRYAFCSIVIKPCSCLFGYHLMGKAEKRISQ